MPTKRTNKRITAASTNKVAVTKSLTPKKVKKARLSLLPKPPNGANKLDSSPRINVIRSDSGWAVGFVTKGPPNGAKAYSNVVDKIVNDPTNMTLDLKLGIYGLVKFRSPDGSNMAKQVHWKTKNGHVKSCDWKVR